MRTIVTIFSGRSNCLQVLNKYLDQLLQRNLIQEVHYWNYTREEDDEVYIKSISNLKRTSSSISSDYIEVFPVIENDSFETSIIASNDFHIKLKKGNVSYEIVLGGWNNTYSVIRRYSDYTDPEIVSFLAKEYIVCNEKSIPFTIRIQNSQLVVFRKNRLILASDVDAGFTMEHIFMKTGFGCSADISYRCLKNNARFFLDTTSKANWSEYYQYYNKEEYNNDVIVKCDDDIVFLDITKFQSYINFVQSTQNDLVFANIINNGVAAYYQQSKYELIPRAMDVYEYPEDGFCGTLWSSGKKAERIHDYFLRNIQLFLTYEYKQDYIPITTRFSINLFAIKGSNWHKIKDVGNGDDEYALTEQGLLTNCMYSAFYVSHLSYGRQNSEFETRELYLNKYNKLYTLFFENAIQNYKLEPDDYYFVDVREWKKNKSETEMKLINYFLDSSFNFMSPYCDSYKQKVVFIDSLLDNTIPWNGRLIRERHGLSGMYVSSILLAEYLSSTGNFAVEYLSNGIIDETYHGVKYTNYNHVNEIKCDFAFITNNMQDLSTLFEKLSYNAVRPRIFSLMRDKFVNTNFLSFIKDYTLEVIYVSDLLRNNCINASCPSINYPYHIIPNCIDIYELFEAKRIKENAFVFFACPSKGLDIAIDIAGNFPEFNLYCNTYNDNERACIVPHEQLIKLNDQASSRYEVYEILSRAKYFIYPLYNSNTHSLHIDSFAYVVLEALVHGVVVLAPRMKLFEELYGDAIYYIDIDGDYNRECFSSWNQTIDEDIIAAMKEKFIEAVCELESDFFLYNSFIEKGMSLKKKFKKDVVGNMVTEIL